MVWMWKLATMPSMPKSVKRNARVGAWFLGTP